MRKAISSATGIQETDRGPLEAMLLYAPCLIDLVAGQKRAIGHDFVWAGNAAFDAWRAAAERRQPMLNLPIGIPNKTPSHRRIMSDRGVIDLRGGYFHQSGCYRAVLPFGDGTYDLSSPAAGIHREVFLHDASGGITFAPIAPSDGRLTLFD